MDIQLCHRCWCMARFNPPSSALRVVVMYLFFIAGHDTMQNFLFLPLNQLFTRNKMPFGFLDLKKKAFLIIPNAFKSFETVVRPTPRDSTSPALYFIPVDKTWNNSEKIEPCLRILVNIVRHGKEKKKRNTAMFCLILKYRLNTKD